MNWDKNDILNERPCLSKQEIESYIQKSLSAQQRFAVENHLLDCPFCNDAVDGYIMHPTQIREKISTVSSYRKWFYLAAACLLLLLGTRTFFNYQKENQTNQIFANNYVTPSWDVQTRGTQKVDAYDRAIRLYNNKQYKIAVSTFDSLLLINPEDNQLRLYKGIAHLESDQSNKAKKELTTVRVNSEIFFEEATWYLAMQSIKIDKKEEAISYLDEIINMKDSFFAPKAIEIKKRLQK